MKNFENKVVVITGAASGLGREFANAAAARHMKLVLADVQQDALELAKEELQGQGVEVLAVYCDVSRASDVQELADTTMKNFGAVHLLFNNAGVGAGGLIWENTLADWEWVFGVNIWGVVHCVRIFTPLMLECATRDLKYRGHIVNTASIAGLLNSPTMGIYNVSKHAVVSLSESLYHDLKLINASIGCSVLCPFFVQTEIAQSHRNRPENLKNESALTVSQRLSQSIIEKAVRGATASASEVAERTFTSIQDEQFYIFTDPTVLHDVRTRMENILQQVNPSDPYEKIPQVRKIVLAKLKSYLTGHN